VSHIQNDMQAERLQIDLVFNFTANSACLSGDKTIN